MAQRHVEQRNREKQGDGEPRGESKRALAFLVSIFSCVLFTVAAASRQKSVLKHRKNAICSRQKLGCV